MNDPDQHEDDQDWDDDDQDWDDEDWDDEDWDDEDWDDEDWDDEEPRFAPFASAGSSIAAWIAGVVGGLTLGIIVPPMLFLIVLRPLTGALNGVIWFLLAVAVCFGLPATGFTMAMNRLDPDSANGKAARGGLRLTGLLSLAVWVLFLLLFGLLIVILASFG